MTSTSQHLHWTHISNLFSFDMNPPIVKEGYPLADYLKEHQSHPSAPTIKIPGLDPRTGLRSSGPPLPFP
jgi:hypothetical protein